MAKPILMHQIKLIIEHSVHGRSIKRITRLTGFARNTVKAYLKRSRDSGLPAEHLLEMDDDALHLVLYPPKAREQG